MTGADFVGLTATLSTFVFKVIASPELKKPEQLKGRKVGISRLGGASDFSIRYALGRWGLVPDKDVAIMQVGGEQEEVLALQNKAVDAVILSEPFATLAIRAGASMLADLSQLGVPYTMHGFGARKSFIRANRDVTIRFMKAYLEGIYVFKTNKDVALNVLKDVLANQPEKKTIAIFYGAGHLKGMEKIITTEMGFHQVGPPMWRTAWDIRPMKTPTTRPTTQSAN